MGREKMSQDRRDAMLWAEEWQIRQKRRKWIIALVVIAVIAALGTVIHFVSIQVSRTTFSSADAMKEALQGRFETDYAEDIEISGDTVTLTYYNPSHYDLEYAENHGYSDYEDSVYEDTVEEWDYRNGEIRCKWMDTITVDKDGNLVYYSQTYKKTDAPRPVPIDPTELSIYKKAYEDAQAPADTGAAEESAETGAEAAEGAEESAGTDTDTAADTGTGTTELSEEEQEAQDAAQESQLETQAAAAEAGIEALQGEGADE